MPAYDLRVSGMQVGYGQKRKWRHARVMSVLMLEADIRQREWHVRLVHAQLQMGNLSCAALRAAYLPRWSTCQDFLARMNLVTSILSRHAGLPTAVSMARFITLLDRWCSGLHQALSRMACASTWKSPFSVSWSPPR